MLGAEVNMMIVTSCSWLKQLFADYVKALNISMLCIRHILGGALL